MTTAQKHAARLREIARFADPELKAALLAGTEALEAQGAWLLRHYRGNRYMIPFDRLNDWQAHILNAEAGEHTAIVPEWAEPVQDDVVITGWRR